MDLADSPPLEWRVLNDQTQVGFDSGCLVVVTYTEAESAAGDKWLEFCWMPVDDPTFVDVHFGVAPGTGSAWETRWQRATEWEYASRTRA